MPRSPLLYLVTSALLLPAACNTQEPTPGAPVAAAVEDLAPAIDRALTWLVAHQDEDGRFDVDDFMKHDREGTKCDGAGNAVHDLGATGLAMLAMLGNGTTMRAGPYKKQLTLAVDWMRKQQQENGRFGTATSHDFIYDHAIATFAMCEAYGLSKYEALKQYAQRGLNYLEAHRNPYAVWRYQPRDNDNDTSVTTWALLALTSGKSFGLEVNEASLKLVATWYDQVTDENGRAGYSKAGEPSSRLVGDHATKFPPERGEAMTAAALAGRFFLGQTPQQTPSMTLSAARLSKKPPEWKSDRIDAYYWYMGTLAMWQMGGESWASWQPGLAQIAGAQRQDANFAGSWDPIGVWDVEGGRVYATALYVMTLQIAHRYTRLMR
ncbi:MAG: prenyltransferase/squalene oxidase repeat-containing protein [Planctomycetota bacterium]